MPPKSKAKLALSTATAASPAALDAATRPQTPPTAAVTLAPAPRQASAAAQAVWEWITYADARDQTHEVTLDDFQLLVQSREVTAETHVWKQPWQEWRSLGDSLIELGISLPTNSRPQPPLAAVQPAAAKLSGVGSRASADPVESAEGWL